MRRVLSAAAAVVLSAGVLALPGPASAAGIEVTSVSVSTPAVSARGLATVPVTVNATASYPDGGCSPTEGAVTLERTDQPWDRSAPSVLAAPMACVAVTGDVHTLRAVVQVPSSAHGSWRVSCIVFQPTCHDPRQAGLPDATLAVTGTHRPRLRLTLAPQPLPYPKRTVTARVRASYDDTDAPVVGRRIVVIAINGDCRGCVGTTDRNGRFVHAVTLADLRHVRASLPLDAPVASEWPPEYSGVSRMVVVGPALFAAPEKGAVRHGTGVAVNGRAMAVGVPSWELRPRVKVYLQRVVGRRWRTVSEVKVRPGGRFTLLATPPKGLNTYRVSMPPQHGLAAATSTRFTIRGT